MSNMFEYLKWRGDILFSQIPPNPVDALIFTTLSYINFRGIVPETTSHWITLEDAAVMFFDDPDSADKIRVKADLELLFHAAHAPRFANVGLSFYQDVFIPEEDTQFAAMTYYLPDGTAFLAFRGTDNTLVGWKEDFNMTFQESIPSQRLAQEYVQSFAAVSKALMHLGGHSKGGNLAMYAAAKSDYFTRKRIVAVYNHDGPGFTEQMMKDPGYLDILPKIRTYVPQSSVFGMLLEREDPHTIIKSSQVGLLQHDPYSWEVMGGNFIPVQELTPDSKFLDKTFKNWLAGMTNEERNEFFDSVFDLLMTDDTSRPIDIIRPQNIKNYIKTLQSDNNMRHVIASELANLIRSARKTHQERQEE